MRIGDNPGRIERGDDPATSRDGVETPSNPTRQRGTEFHAVSHPSLADASGYHAREETGSDIAIDVSNGRSAGSSLRSIRPAFMQPAFMQAGLLSAVFLIFVVAKPSHAAPPKVDHLFPAGGQRSSTVTVKVATKPFDPKPSIWCSDPELKPVFAEKADSISVEIPADTIPGLRWFRFYNEEGCSDARPFIVGMIPEIAEIEPNNRIAEAQPVELPSVCINGVLHARRENDSFKVALKAGQTLVASMDANRSLGSPMDGVLQLVSTKGFVLAQNDDDHGFDPQLVFTANEDGDYIVRTFAFPATPNSTVGFSGAANYVYRLTLTTDPFLDHLMPPVISDGESSEPRPLGWNLAEESTDNIRVAKIDDAFHSAFEDSGSNLIPVATSKLPIVIETVDGQTGSGHHFSIPATLCGTISKPTEFDQFRFDGKKGQKITARVEARTLYSRLDAVLVLTGSDGKVIKEVDDSTRNVADCQLSVTLPADGEYSVGIRDRFDHAGFRYFYAVHVSEPASDFSIKAAGNPLKVAGDKPTKLTVDIVRNNFTDNIAVAVTGLPEGVDCKSVTSEGKGKTAKKVELQFTSKRTESWSGPFRIEGRSPDGKLVRNAAAKTVDLRRLSDYWLTVSPKK